jgi:triosephosphate isomerase
MNFGPAETRAFLESIQIAPKSHATLRLYVPYLSLAPALEVVKKRNLPIQIGAQNAHFEKSGAFTGEIALGMLAEIGIRQVLIGHSERRQYFNETDETVLKRTVAALDAGFEVLVCVGETLQQREQNQTEAVLKQQMALLLSDSKVKAAFGTQLHVAYEPVWAIGTGKVASPEQAEAAHAYIRGLLSSALKPEQVDATHVLYGGSVSPSNFAEILKCPNINGGLVGGASLKLESWTQLWDLV